MERRPDAASVSPESQSRRKANSAAVAGRSQALCLNTTVPINLAGSDIGGRHTPTKQALRHSRMIAMHKSGTKERGRLSVITKHPTLAKYFLSLQIIIAAFILFISASMFLRTRNFKDRDNPHWSGGLLLISGLTNAVFLICCRKKFSNDSSSWYAFYPKIFSLIVTIFASLMCLCALVFSSMHVYVIKTAECESVGTPNQSCECHVTSSNQSSSFDILDVDTLSYKYPLLTCAQVESFLVITLIGSAVTNALGAVISLYYVFLHKTATVSRKYSQVPMTEQYSGFV